MDYSEQELNRDIADSNRRYDIGRISFEQRQQEFKGYISMVKNEDEDKAKKLAQRLGVDFDDIK